MIGVIVNSIKASSNLKFLLTLGLTALSLTSCYEQKTEVKEAPKVESISKVIEKREQPKVEAVTTAGEEGYKKTCFACHNTGVTGAPKLDDKGDWAPRIAKGIDSLYFSAINGYKGVKGTMPPKGGNTSLSDEEVKQIVDYMVSVSQK